MAIPKVIHYCWFGGNPKPKLAEKCIKSWKKHCPDYEIIEWNESNFDIGQNRYCREAYEAGKWAFVTDYARLKIIFEHGGFYFDTDVELRKSLDPLLTEQCFMGIENSIRCIKVNTGLGMGAESHAPLLQKLLSSYDEVSFLKPDGTPDLTTCTVRNTEVLKKHGYIEENRMQKVAGATIYPTDYFSPIVMENEDKKVTPNTYSIHHYALSWTSKKKQAARKRNLRTYRVQNFIYNIIVLPNRLICALLGEAKYQELKQRIRR